VRAVRITARANSVMRHMLIAEVEWADRAGPAGICRDALATFHGSPLDWLVDHIAHKRTGKVFRK
jgi:hypothetical protein